MRCSCLEYAGHGCEEEIMPFNPEIFKMVTFASNNDSHLESAQEVSLVATEYSTLTYTSPHALELVLNRTTTVSKESSTRMAIFVT